MGHRGLVETILPHLALKMLMDEISFHFSAPGVNKADFTASKQQRKKKPKQRLQIGSVSGSREPQGREGGLTTDTSSVKR